MQKIRKYLNIMTIVMAVITTVILVLFLAGGAEPNQAMYSPIYTDELLYWSYILLFIAVILAVIFPIIKLISNPKGGLKALLLIGVAAVLFLVAYALADGTPLKMPGYTGSDNVPSMLIMTDVLLYVTYFLGGFIVLAILYSEISKRFK